MTVTPEQFGAVGDGNADDTNALNMADAQPNEAVYLTPGKTYRADGQLLLGQTSGKRWFTDGARGSSIIKSYYNGGKNILIGQPVALINDVEFDGIGFVQDNSVLQPLFEVRGVRGTHFKRVDMDGLYYGFDLGTLTRSCAIIDLYDCEVNMKPGHSHFMNVVNCPAQIDLCNSYVEGSFAPGSAGLRIANNVAGTIDHTIFKGGYFGRFDVNFDIASRVVNFQLGADLLIEGHQTAGIRFRDNASFEAVTIKSKFGATGPNSLHHIHIGYSQITNNCLGFMVDGSSFQTIVNQPAIEIACPANQKIEELQLTNLTFASCKDISDNNHSVIELWQVNSGLVNNIVAKCFDPTKRYAYAVRSQGSGTNMLVGGNISAAGFASGTSLRT